MHNYNDVEHDHGPDTNTPDKSTYGKNPDGTPDPVRARTVMRSRRIADLLSSRGWKGWPNGTAGYPGIFITEGGADTDRLANIYPGRSYADILTIPVAAAAAQPQSAEHRRHRLGRRHDEQLPLVQRSTQQQRQLGSV